MCHYYSVLKENPLFSGFTETEMDEVLQCLQARTKQYKKNAIVRESGEKVGEIGIVVKGAVYLTKTDYHGNRTILSERIAGQAFGETLSCTEMKNSPVSVVAAKESTIVFIPISRIIGTGSNECKFRIRMLENLIKLLAERNFMLQIKNDILSRKTTREKLLLYLEYESKTAGSKAFKIDFSREELADFLSLNASAMSRELGKMRDEGILSFKKNRFVLKDKAKTVM